MASIVILSLTLSSDIKVIQDLLYELQVSKGTTIRVWERVNQIVNRWGSFSTQLGKVDMSSSDIHTARRLLSEIANILKTSVSSKINRLANAILILSNQLGEPINTIDELENAIVDGKLSLDPNVVGAANAAEFELVSVKSEFPLLGEELLTIRDQANDYVVELLKDTSTLQKEMNPEASVSGMDDFLKFSGESAVETGIYSRNFTANAVTSLFVTDHTYSKTDANALVVGVGPANVMLIEHEKTSKLVVLYDANGVALDDINLGTLFFLSACMLKIRVRRHRNKAPLIQLRGTVVPASLATNAAASAIELFVIGGFTSQPITVDTTINLWAPSDGTVNRQLQFSVTDVTAGVNSWVIEILEITQFPSSFFLPYIDGNNTIAYTGTDSALWQNIGFYHPDVVNFHVSPYTRKVFHLFHMYQKYLNSRNKRTVANDITDWYHNVSQTITNVPPIVGVVFALAELCSPEWWLSNQSIHAETMRAMYKHFYPMFLLHLQTCACDRAFISRFAKEFGEHYV